ncbi:hypothetical protein [Leptotrichia alba]|uniref:Uncharacterized protein n=1 Tax=Leptotrichia alba TaxID=3239304 RepID=A0AB39V5E0_9FUSO
MKYLRYLLSFTLVILIIMFFGVMFSSNIVSFMTKTKYSKFENVKFSVKNHEMVFDNFVVNGKSLGKGRATVWVIRTGLFKFVPKLTLSNLRLEDVNLESIYKDKNSQIDTFTNKIDSLTAQEKTDKTTDDFIKETTGKVTDLKTNTDNFINSKVKNIEKINTLKKDYGEITDLKNKAQKIIELNNEIKPLVQAINVEKENIEKNISKIELERDITLTNVSNNLTKLEKEISLNDFKNINSSDNAQNMNLYIFLDKGKNLEISLNNALKATSLVREIKELNILISDININNGKIKVSGLNGDISKINGEILLDGNTKALVNGQNNDYIITYNKDTLNTKTLFTANKISSIIEYSKNDLLEGKVMKLSSELILENNNFKNLNRTVLTDEEKTLLTKKIENLRNNNYQQIMTKYEEDNKNIETLIDNVYAQKNKLDKLQRDLLSLGTIITTGQPATAINENDSQNNNSTINILNNSNSSNTNAENQNTSQNSSKDSNRINIGQ